MNSARALMARALMVCAMAAAAAAPASGETPAEKGAAQLAQMLEGRVAGEPETCILIRPINRMTVVEGQGLVFRSGATLWVNPTADPAAVRKWDTFEFRSFGQRLCSYDTVNGRQGPIDLIEFIPYRKAAG